MITKSKTLQKQHSQLHFSLEKYGYTLDRILNNENRWHTKIVCSIWDKDFRHYVSTAYADQIEYLKLIETTTFLNCNKKLSPQIAKVYSQDNTVICKHLGEFLSGYLLNNEDSVITVLDAIFEYLKEINSVNQSYKTFTMPTIIKTSLELSKEFASDFKFLPKSKTVLTKLEKSANKFYYGCGVEDPHIWNFRIVKTPKEIRALTTDFDYFSDKVNCFWELGYFYATLRWLKKEALPIRYEAEKIILSFIQNEVLKVEFMFWLGVLSSYCGYKDSLHNLITNETDSALEEQHRMIRELDEKVSYLANQLL